MKKTKKLFKENKVFRRVLAVVLSLSIIAGVAAVIAMAAPQPKAANVDFQLTPYEMYAKHTSGGGRIDRHFYFNNGTIDKSVSGQATANPNPGYQFACWTKSPNRPTSSADIYSYSPTIRPNEDGTYYAWFAHGVLYEGQNWYIGTTDGRADNRNSWTYYGTKIGIDPNVNSVSFYAYWNKSSVDNGGNIEVGDVPGWTKDDNEAFEAAGTRDHYFAHGERIGPGLLLVTDGWSTLRFDETTFFVLPRNITLEHAAQGDPDYSFQNFPVTMFNYEQNAFSAQNPGTPDTIRFLDCNRSPVYSGYTNADGHTGATQQIWSSKLVNGLPVPYGSNTAVPEEVNKLAQYGYPAGGNSNLFSPNDGSNLTEHGKQPYQNVMFQFLKHETGSNAGYYEYNSAYNHAYFDEATEDNVKPYFESLRRNDEDKLNNGQNEAGGFYPFVSNLNGASYYRNFFREDFRSYSAWKTNYEKFTRVDGTGGSQQKGVFYGTADMHFGMVMDFDFYLPEYGTVNGTANGDPITFQFSGDDDLWVYIDDELVLDVGGGHGAISGDINFKTQKSYVEDATQRAGANYAAQHVGAVTKDINVEGDKIHNIKIFYLERYSGVSNCRIKFNLPPIPPATVNVKKDVTTLDGTDVSVPNDEFRFNIRATEQNGTTINTANRDYEIVDNQNNVVGNGTTDASGNFKIKADQTARFSGFKATDKFAVTEYIDNVEKYNQVNIDGVLAGKGNTVYATPLAQITNKGKTVEFTNILTDPLATAKFNKTADALKDVDGNYTGEYEIYLTVTGATPGRKVNVTDVVSKYFTVVSPAGLTRNADGTTTVNVSGTTDSNGDWTGVIKIVPRDGFWGGNAVPTNAGDPVFNSEAGISHSFKADPKVNVAPNLPLPLVYHYEIYLGQYVNIPELVDAGMDLGDMPEYPKWADDFIDKGTLSINFTSSDNSIDDDHGTIRHVGDFEVYGRYDATPLTSGEGFPGPVIEQKPIVVRETNTLTVKGCTLTVRKTSDDMNSLDGHDFIFNIKGSATGNVLEQKIDHKIVLNSGNNYTAVLEDLPIGTYTVQEDGWSWRFTANGNGTVTLTPDAKGDHGEITLKNSKTESKWLDHEYNKKNVFGN